MELIKEIRGTDVGLAREPPNAHYQVRRRAEAVVLNQADKVALLYASHYQYHHLPCGRVHGGEDVLTALAREIKEETGANVDVVAEIGVIIEHGRIGECGLLQISYAYFARIKGNIGEPFFTDEETADGLALEWVDLDEAIKLSESDQPDSDAGKFIRMSGAGFPIAGERVNTR